MRLSGPTSDSADPLALTEFYERLFGWPIVRREGPGTDEPSSDGWAVLRPPSSGVKIEIQWEPHYRPRAGPASRASSW